MTRTTWETPWKGVEYSELIVSQATSEFEAIMLSCLVHPLYLVRPPVQDATGEFVHHIVERGWRGHCCKGYTWLEADDGEIWVIFLDYGEFRFPLCDPQLFDKIKHSLKLMLMPRPDRQFARAWFNKDYD